MENSALFMDNKKVACASFSPGEAHMTNKLANQLMMASKKHPVQTSCQNMLARNFISEKASKKLSDNTFYYYDKKRECGDSKSITLNFMSKIYGGSTRIDTIKDNQLIYFKKNLSDSEHKEAKSQIPNFDSPHQKANAGLPWPQYTGICHQPTYPLTTDQEEAKQVRREAQDLPPPPISASHRPPQFVVSVWIQQQQQQQQPRRRADSSGGS
ncbi:hypothetical protein L345_02978, partial [Ophiophagus hannah]